LRLGLGRFRLVGKAARGSYPDLGSTPSESTGIKVQVPDVEADMTENVNHPAHYGGADNPYEVIKVAEAWGFDKNAYLFNVLKYIARPGKGRTLEDLKKARWYLDRLIGRLEGVQEMQADAEEKIAAMERHPAGLTDHQKFVKKAIERLESTDINTDEVWRTGYNRWADRTDS
jgi:hypothetical protein